MSLSDLWRGKRAVKARTADEQYRAVVRDQATGKPAKPERDIPICEAAGKAPEDLEADVKRYQDLMAKAERYSKLPELLAKIESHKATIAAELKIRDAAIQRCSDVAGPLEWELPELYKEEQKLRALVPELAAACPDEKRLAKKAAEEKHIAELAQGRAAAVAALDAHKRVDPEALVRKQLGLPRSWPGEELIPLSEGEMNRMSKGRAELETAKAAHQAEAHRLKAEVDRYDGAIRKAEQALADLALEMAQLR